jgi:hypothetical protein
MEVVAMRRRWLGLLLVLVLATAPGCRTMGYAAVAVGAAGVIVAEGFARSEAYTYPRCDYHSIAPPTRHCQ